MPDANIDIRRTSLNLSHGVLYLQFQLLLPLIQIQHGSPFSQHYSILHLQTLLLFGPIHRIILDVQLFYLILFADVEFMSAVDVIVLEEFHLVYFLEGLFEHCLV